MPSKTQKLIDLINKMPEHYIDDVLGAVNDVLDEKLRQKKAKPSACPYCRSASVSKNGHNRSKQRYRCMDCGKTFVETTGSVIHHSHFGDYIWKQAIRDALDGTSITESAERLNITRPTARSMRRNIADILDSEEAGAFLMSQSKAQSNPNNKAESKIIETYILENLKTREAMKDTSIWNDKEVLEGSGTS